MLERKRIMIFQHKQKWENFSLNFCAKNFRFVRINFVNKLWPW